MSLTTVFPLTCQRPNQLQKNVPCQQKSRASGIRETEGRWT
jgi:hypothetical protein